MVLPFWLFDIGLRVFYNCGNIIKCVTEYLKMSVDYKALCEELFGTSDVDELKALSEQLNATNARGAGRKYAHSKSEMLMMSSLRKNGIPVNDVAEQFGTTRQTVARLVKMIHSEKGETMMHKNTDVAKYFLSLDKDHELFTNEVVKRNGRTFYEGNARLNKYLHLAQNIYIAKTGRPLMDTRFYAYDNGAVDPEIMEQYVPLLKDENHVVYVTKSEEAFLKRFYIAFQNASLEELIEIDHEDPAWIEKKDNYRKADQVMDTMRYAEDYKTRYADMVKVLDRIAV